MRNLILLILLISSCVSKKEENNHPFRNNIKLNEVSESLTKIDLLNLYDFSLKDFTIDSVNKYGAGDCWGTVYQYSFKDKLIGIDTMTCGDYGFHIKKFLISQDKLLVAHIQKSNTLIGFDGPKSLYELSEKFIDLRSKPNLYFYRKDTVREPKFELIDNEIKQEKINPEIDPVIDILLNEYKGAWEMNEDY